MTTYEKNYNYGINGEEKIYNILKKKYPSIEIKKDRYCFYDLLIKDLNVLIEVKKRNNSKDTYPTTIFRYEKLIKFKDFNNKNGNKYRFMFIFIYNNGIYLIHKKNYKYHVKYFRRSFRDNINDKYCKHVFLPVSDLLHIDSINMEL